MIGYFIPSVHLRWKFHLSRLNGDGEAKIKVGLGKIVVY